MVKRTRRNRVRHEDRRENIGVSPLLNKIDATQLRWFGTFGNTETKKLQEDADSGYQGVKTRRMTNKEVKENG